MIMYRIYLRGEKEPEILGNIIGYGLEIATNFLVFKVISSDQRLRTCFKYPMQRVIKIEEVVELNSNGTKNRDIKRLETELEKGGIRNDRKRAS